MLRRARAAWRWLSAEDPITGAAMAVVCVYYAVTWGAFQGKAAGDGWFGFLYLKAIVFYQTIDMQTVAPEYLPFFGRSGPGQHMPNRCPIGPVFVWLPFYLVSVIPEWIGRLVGYAPLARMGGKAPFQVWVTGLGTLTMVLLGWRATFRLLERQVGRPAARVGAGAAIFCTPLLWYACHHPFYQHGIAFGVVAILLEHWERTLGDPSPRRLLWLGLLGGYAMTVRAQELMWFLLPAGEIAWRVARGPKRRRWLVGGLLAGAAAIVAFSPQVLAWYYYSGGIAPVQAEPIRWGQPFFTVALFSTRAGLFPWTPVAYAAALGLTLALVGRTRASSDPRRARLVAAALLAAFAAELYLVASAWVLHGGFTYGNRRLSDAAVVIGLGVAFAWRAAAERRWPRRLLAGFLAFTLLLNVTLVELLRLRKIRGSGADARSFASMLERDLGAPGWLVATFDRIGWPFSQPAGWLFALRHGARPSAFEEVAGHMLLARDGQWFQLERDFVSLPLVPKGRRIALSGLAWPDDPRSPAAPEVTGEVTLLLSFFAKEPIEVQLAGSFPAGAVAARWNGEAVPADRRGGGVHLSVPVAAMRAGVNRVTLTLPVGSRLERLDFQSISRWW